MPSRQSRLVDLYEQCLGWLRGGGRGSRHQVSIEPVRIDLVGDPLAEDPLVSQGRGQPATSNPPEASSGPTTTFGTDPLAASQATSSSALTTNPFGGAGLATANRALARPWSFNQTVLLQRKRRSSSVLMWTAVGTVTAVGIWAVTAPLSETIAVQGKLEPGQATQRVDAPVPGVVEAVLVKEGQQVRKGEPLVRFDLREPRSKLAAAESIRARLLNENQVAAATLGDSAATAGLSANQRRQLLSQTEELASRREAARQELRKSEARLAGYRSTLATYQNIANRYANLVAQGAASEVQLLEARQQVQETESSIAQEFREIARLESSLVNTGALTDVELRRQVEANLREIADLDSQIRLARQQIQYGQLTSPVDGVVFDIEVGSGSVVAQGTGSSASTGSKPLLKVVPQDALQATVYLPNQAVGFVRPGLRAELSIEAFRASDFGYIPAVVERVGSDALTAEEQSRVLGTDATGLYFPAVLRLERQNVQLRNKQAPLQAGMSLTADIKLRERRFISILTGFLEDQRRNLERLR